MSGQSVDADGPVLAWVFGKMPAHGDFISRGLDDDAVEAGDTALAEAMDLAAARWDHDWDDVYIETPVWRFLASPGLFSRHWISGVFLPSVDAVGRQFPLMAGFAAASLALLGRPDITSRALEEAEATVRQALLEALPVDAVLDRLTATAVRLFAVPAIGSGEPAAIFAGRLLYTLESAPWSPQSIWWVAGGGPTVAIDGKLSGESLCQLFRQAEPVAQPPDGAFAEPLAEAQELLAEAQELLAEAQEGADSAPGTVIKSDPPDPSP